MKKINLKNILTLSFSFTTAILLLVMLIVPAITNAKQNMDTLVNCINANIPMGQELNIFTDSDTGIITISYVDGVGQEQVTYFNFKQNTNKCSESAKSIINDVKEGYDKHETDICNEIRDVIVGKKQMPERDGYKPSMNAAKQYIKTQCKDH